MWKQQEEVQEFMRLGGQAVGDHPELSPIEPESQVAMGRLHAEIAALVLRLGALRGLAPLRARLILEESGETTEGLSTEDLVAVADGLIDNLYVTIGAAAAFGIDLEPIWDAVHGANLAKFPACEACNGVGNLMVYGDGISVAGQLAACGSCDGRGRVAIRDAQGKVMKPRGWKPADVGAVLDAQGAVYRPDDPQAPLRRIARAAGCKCGLPPLTWTNPEHHGTGCPMVRGGPLEPNPGAR